MAMRNALLASSSWPLLIDALIIRWESFYGLRRPGSTFTIRSDHMRGWITSLRSNLLSYTSWRIFLLSSYCDVYFSRDWTFLHGMENLCQIRYSLKDGDLLLMR